jgi:hypothetical protein
MRKNLFQPFLYFLFSIIFIQSCDSNDPCKVIDCGQSAVIPTGECVEGVCECLPNYEGDYCAYEYAFKFVGTYHGNEALISTYSNSDTTFKDTLIYPITPALPIIIKRSTPNTISVLGLANSNLNSFVLPVSKANIALPSALRVVCTNLKGTATAFDSELTMDATYNPSSETLSGTYTLKWTETINNKIYEKVTKSTFSYKKL